MCVCLKGSVKARIPCCRELHSSSPCAGVRVGPAAGGHRGWGPWYGDFLVSVGSRPCGRGLEEPDLPASPSWANLTPANRQSLSPLTHPGASKAGHEGKVSEALL